MELLGLRTCLRYVIWCCNDVVNLTRCFYQGLMSDLPESVGHMYEFDVASGLEILFNTSIWQSNSNQLQPQYDSQILFNFNINMTDKFYSTSSIWQSNFIQLQLQYDSQIIFNFNFNMTVKLYSTSTSIWQSNSIQLQLQYYSQILAIQLLWSHCYNASCFRSGAPLRHARSLPRPCCGYRGQERVLYEVIQCEDCAPRSAKQQKGG